MMIWVVEDEKKIGEVIRQYLIDANYECRLFTSADGLLRQLEIDPPGLIVLDRKLPGIDGIDLCRHIRRLRSQIPIIMVTARVEEQDRLDGLQAGADDYICKPFSPRELVARVATVLRRGPLQKQTALHIDAANRVAKVREQALDLTPAEFSLLATLARSPGRPYSRDQLLSAIQSEDRDVSDRAIDSHVKNLRRKLSAVKQPPFKIAAVYGLGYCLKAID